MNVTSTVSPPNVRPLKPYDRLLVDQITGSPIGIENSSGGGEHGYFYPVPLSAAEIASPSAAVLANTSATYCLNVAPYTRYRSDGDELVGLSGGIEANPTGIFANLATVPSGTPALIVGANSQAIIYSPWTIQNAGGVEVRGELRVYAWL